MNNRLYHLSLFFISAALLSLEVSLMRILKVEGFGNFTFGAIALALTGFGASGTLVSLFLKRIRGRELLISRWSPVLFCLFLGLAFHLSMLVEFDALRILWDRNQLFRLLFRFALYTIPFVLGSAFVVLAFLTGQPGRVYFFNLAGSGVGIFAILGCLYLIPPSRILILPLVMAASSALCMSFTLPSPPARRFLPLALILPGIVLLLTGDIVILPFKARELALNLPDARILVQKNSPFGTLEVIASEKLRIAPGLSLTFEGTLPRQHGLFIDGDLHSSIDRIEGRSSLDYLLYQSQSAVYQLYRNPRVFVAGLGGGVPLERSIRNGALTVLASEENPHIPMLLTGPFRDFTGNLLGRSGVSVGVGGGRSVLARDGAKWDVIDVTENTLSSSVGGIYAADTNFTLTVSAFGEYLAALGPGGTVSATVPLKQPPRNLPRLAATTMGALRRVSPEPERCIVVIRSWASGTVLLKDRPFSPEDIDRIKSFCGLMRFDLVYYPGMAPEEANRFNIVENSIYYRTVVPVVCGDRRFVKRYLFNIHPATDDRPYFAYSFRISKLGELFEQTGTQWLLVVEGGYIVLFATFLSTLLLAAVFILLPPLWAGRRMTPRGIFLILYFSMIAVGFMFIEILVMQQFRRFVANPLYSNSLVIATLLISTGIASYRSDRIASASSANALDKIVPGSKEPGKLASSALFHALIFLSAYLVTLVAAFHLLFPHLLKASPIIELFLPVLATAPLGLCMGLFFPLGMSALKGQGGNSVPWAWSINGFFSVIASTGAVIVASSAGLIALGAAALVCYWTAFFFFPSS
jgi:hypothetical protein